MESDLVHSQRNMQQNAMDVLPASQYLQERLQERRARNVRPKRLRQSDFGPRRGLDDDIFLSEATTSQSRSDRRFDSSPAAATLGMDGDHTNSGQRRAMGLKGVDEHMDRLTKENFALKLELDHRRDHTAKLQEKIEDMRAQAERAERLQEEHAELLKINSQLVEELEKRDKAVEEAMDIICDLEDQINDLEERQSVTRPSTANADSGYAGTEVHDQIPPSSPPEMVKPPSTPIAANAPSPAAVSMATNRLLHAVNGKAPARSRREPSVLSQKKQSTHMLRTVFLENTKSLHPVKSFNSLLTRRESRALDEEEVLNSPRLSVLSESSFPSMYAQEKNASPDRFAWEAEEHVPSERPQGPSPHLRQDSIKRVSQWMDDRDLTAETPSKSNHITSPLSQQIDANSPTSEPRAGGDVSPYRSLGDVLSAGDKEASNLTVEASDAVQYIRPFPIRPGRASGRQPRPTSFGGPMFGEPLLPPTPDSASTRMLRASRSTINEDRSLLDTTPIAVRGYDPLEPGIRTAPRVMRSSVELKNAYQSYVQRQDATPAANIHEAGAPADADSETVHDFSMEYDGFPDGGSILMGTPSRFLKHGKPPCSIPNDGYEPPPVITTQPPLVRRQSGSEATFSPAKPILNRADTSPPMHFAPNMSFAIGLNTSRADNLNSSRSYYSGSSSNRTVMLPERHDRTVSPELYRSRPQHSPPRSRQSPSPARTFSQKAHGILRRLSNTQRDAGADREKSPLPTLTSAPASAYLQNVPKDSRRPGTSYSGGESSTPPSYYPPAPWTVDSKRPAMQARMNTAPYIPARPMSASIPDQPSPETERRGFFKRSNSAKHQEAGVDSSGGKPSSGKRRGSFRDAVTSATKLPWK